MTRIPSTAAWALIAALCSTPAVRAQVSTLDVQVGDRVEYTRTGRLERGTITSLNTGEPGRISGFTVIQDRDNDTFTVFVPHNTARKLEAATAPTTHTAPPKRPRAPCPAPQARQNANASSELVRALIVCTLEDNSGSYMGKTVNVDVLSFRMGRAIRNRDAPVTLRYAAPDAVLHTASVRYNQRIYTDAPFGSVTHFDDVERQFTVYVDLHDRWAVGWNRVNDGRMRTTALPR